MNIESNVALRCIKNMRVSSQFHFSLVRVQGVDFLLKQKSSGGRRFGILRINSEDSLTSYVGRTLRVLLLIPISNKN